MWTLWQMFHGTKYASIPRNRIWTVPKRYLMSQVYNTNVCVWKTEPHRIFFHIQRKKEEKNIYTQRDYD